VTIAELIAAWREKAKSLRIEYHCEGAELAAAAIETCALELEQETNEQATI
jgi:hypothetical protein